MIRTRSRHLDRVAALAANAAALFNRQEIHRAQAVYGDAMRILEHGPPFLANEAVRLLWAADRAGIRLALGRVDLALGHPEAARVQLESALRQYEALFPTGSEAVADALTALGAALEKAGDFTAADQRLQQAVRITRMIGASTERVAQALTALSLARQSMGDLDGALAAAREALTLPGLSPATVVELQGNLAFHHRGAGDLAEALRLYQRQWTAIEGLEADRTIARGTLSAALCRGNIGEVYAQMGQYEPARRHQAASLGLMRRAAPGSTILAGALNNHAVLLMRGGDTVAAEAVLREGLTICLTHAPRTPIVAVIGQHLARVQLDRGDPRQALATIRDMIASFPGEVRSGRQFIGAYLVAASAYLATEDLEGAALMVRHAAGICDRISPWIPERTDLHTALGLLAESRGDLDEAIREYERSIAVSERHRLGAADEPGLETYFAQSSATYHALIEAAFRRGREGDDALAFRAAEGIRARTLADLLARRGTAFPALPPRVRALREREARLYRGAAALARSLSALAADETELGDSLRRRLAGTEEELERLRAAIRSAIPAALPDPGSPVCSVNDVQARLDDGTALVSYEVTGTSVFLWVISRSSRVFRRLTPPGVDVLHTLDEAIGRLRDDAAAEPAGALRHLSQWLIEPVLAVMPPEVSRLMFSTTGRLAYVPFAALPLRNGRLVDGYESWSVPSATTMVRFGAGPHAPAFRAFAGFALAGPQNGYADLEAGRREVREAAALFPDGTFHIGRSATPAAFRARSRDVRLLHIATHASIDERQPLYSGLLLAPDPDRPDSEPFLNLHDIADLDLRAELVVCAACDSARGSLRDGEGLVGFSRAFLAAGASAVLLSLWPVRDIHSQRIMRFLYRALRAGSPPTAALTTAVRQARERWPVLFADIRSWSGFVLVSTVAPAGRRAG